MAQRISMTQIPPQGVLRLYSDIDIGGGRQKIFRTKAEQKAYFDRHLVMSFNDLSYMRLNDGIQIETDTLSISNCNYLSFINKTTGLETEIYAAISPNWEYVNPNTVKIQYSVDWWQTCMHAGITMKEGLVRREHMNETDWNTAVANPYADLFQLQTSEDLPMDESMERFADATTSDISIIPGIPSHDGVEGVTPSDMRLVLILGQHDLTQLEPNPNNPTITMQYLINQIKNNGGDVRYDQVIQGVPNICTIFIMQYLPVEIGPSASITLFNRLMELIEFNGITGNIVGLYWIPHEYVDVFTQEYIRLSITPTPYNYTPRNPKLYRSPYCYLRVSDETGQYKHYEYENFKNLIDGQLMIQFDLFYSQTGLPAVMIAPRNYKHILAGASSEEKLAVNFDEAIVHEDIPYLPYSTDGYLSALGAQYRENWSSTNPVKNVLTNSVMQGAQKAETGDYNIANILGVATRYIRHPIKTGEAIAKSIEQGDTQPLVDYTNEGRKGIQNMLTGTGLNLQKATVADNYNAGSPKGWVGYMRAPMRFILQKVAPRPAIVEQYDKYFDYFGYNSGRIGLPYVYNYIKQSGDQPHFATIGNDQATYCQANIMVYMNGKAPEIASRAIEEMFANGILFTK